MLFNPAAVRRDPGPRPGCRAGPGRWPCWSLPRCGLTRQRQRIRSASRSFGAGWQSTQRCTIDQSGWWSTRRSGLPWSGTGVRMAGTCAGSRSGSGLQRHRDVDGGPRLSTQRSASLPLSLFPRPPATNASHSALAHNSLHTSSCLARARPSASRRRCRLFGDATR